MEKQDAACAVSSCFYLFDPVIFKLHCDWRMSSQCAERLEHADPVVKTSTKSMSLSSFVSLQLWSRYGMSISLQKPFCSDGVVPFCLFKKARESYKE